MVEIAAGCLWVGDVVVETDAVMTHMYEVLADAADVPGDPDSVSVRFRAADGETATVVLDRTRRVQLLKVLG